MINEKILILGVGNVLLGDEGFGVHAVDYLAAKYVWPPNVQLLDGATRGLMLMSEIMECDLLIVLDIVLAGRESGTTYVLEEEMPAAAGIRQSVHQGGIGDILACCDLAGHKPRAIIYGFEPFDWQTPSVDLTSEASACLPRFCGKVVTDLRRRGVIIEKRD